MKWYAFDPAKGYRQKRPPEKKYVLVKLKAAAPRVIKVGGDEARRLHSSMPGPIAVGYRKDGGGDKDSPFFVVPGIGGEVIEWCDCLPDGFEWRSSPEDP